MRLALAMDHPPLSNGIFPGQETLHHGGTGLLAGPSESPNGRNAGGEALGSRSHTTRVLVNTGSSGAGRSIGV